MIIGQNHYLFWRCISYLKYSGGVSPPLYSQLLFQYNTERLIEKKIAIEPCSFVILRDSIPVIGIIATIVVDKGVRQLSCGEIPAICYEANSNQKDREQFFLEIKKLAATQFILRDYLTNGFNSFFSSYLLSEGGQKKLLVTPLINLQDSLDLIRKRIRRRFKTYINWGGKNFKFKIYSTNNVSNKCIENFKELHSYSAERSYRSEGSWNTLLNIVRGGEGFLIFVFYQDDLITSASFIFDKRVCYYRNSISQKVHFDKPIMHGVIWEAMKYAKALGCLYFDMSELSDENDKLRNIAKFKTGFGSELKEIVDLQYNRPLAEPFTACSTK